MKKGAVIGIVFVLLIVVVIVIFSINTGNDDSDERDGTVTSVSYSGILEDVTNGKILLGIKFDGKSSGTVSVVSGNGVYSLLAEFENLPDPQGTDFYEGWVVRKGLSFSVISTGLLVKENGRYVNRFESNQDLSDHLDYVLTIEPDDGDPAPADHVLEGFLMSDDVN
jgi:hypothetical protein